MLRNGILFSFLLIFLLAFQNCGPGYSALFEEESLENLESIDNNSDSPDSEALPPIGGEFKIDGSRMHLQIDREFSADLEVNIRLEILPNEFNGTFLAQVKAKFPEVFSDEGLKVQLTDQLTPLPDSLALALENHPGTTGIKLQVTSPQDANVAPFEGTFSGIPSAIKAAGGALATPAVLLNNDRFRMGPTGIGRQPGSPGFFAEPIEIDLRQHLDPDEKVIILSARTVNTGFTYFATNLGHVYTVAPLLGEDPVVRVFESPSPQNYTSMEILGNGIFTVRMILRDSVGFISLCRELRIPTFQNCEVDVVPANTVQTIAMGNVGVLALNSNGEVFFSESLTRGVDGFSVVATPSPVAKIYGGHFSSLGKAILKFENGNFGQITYRRRLLDPDDPGDLSEVTALNLNTQGKDLLDLRTSPLRTGYILAGSSSVSFVNNTNDPPVEIPTTGVPLHLYIDSFNTTTYLLDGSIFDPREPL